LKSEAVDDDGLDLVRDIVKPIHVRERRLFRRGMVFLITGWSSALVAGRLEHADGLLRARCDWRHPWSQMAPLRRSMCAWRSRSTLVVVEETTPHGRQRHAQVTMALPASRWAAIGSRNSEIPVLMTSLTSSLFVIDKWSQEAAPGFLPH
jgi:hypothetical protein